MSTRGLQSGFNSIDVNPDDAAVNKPFERFSLSSYPGSPKLTEVSIQPLETCRLSSMILFSDLALILSAISAIIPFLIRISFFLKFKLLLLSTNVADFMSILI